MKVSFFLNALLLLQSCEGSFCRADYCSACKVLESKKQASQNKICTYLRKTSCCKVYFDNSSKLMSQLWINLALWISNYCFCLLCQFFFKKTLFRKNAINEFAIVVRERSIVWKIMWKVNPCLYESSITYALTTLELGLSLSLRSSEELIIELNSSFHFFPLSPC